MTTPSPTDIPDPLFAAAHYMDGRDLRFDYICPQCRTRYTQQQECDWCPDRVAEKVADGVKVPVRFFRIEPAQTHLGTIYRVKDERGQWVADFAERPEAERFARTPGVDLPEGAKNG